MRQQFGFVPRPHHAHIQREVARAERQPPDPGAGTADAMKVADANRGFDDRDQVDGTGGQIARLLQIADQPIGGAQFVRVLDLREHDAVQAGAADGFMLTFNQLPQNFDAFVDGVIPELQRRGLFQTEYRGATLRENLDLPIPRAADWHAGRRTPQ